MTNIYVERGLDPSLARQVAEALTAKDAFATHARDELGLSAHVVARPIQAALTSAVSIQKASPPRLGHLSEQSNWLFVRKLLLIVGIGAFALAFWRLSDVLLLAFGSILLALVLRGLADIVSGRTRISEGVAVAAVVIMMASAFAAFAWLFGSQIAKQFELLSEDLPQGISKLVNDLRTTQWGGWFFLRAQEVNLSSATTQVTGYITAVFGSIIRTAGYLAVLLFASIYLAAQPDRYLHGFLRLVPQNVEPFSDGWLDSQSQWPSSDHSLG